MGLTRRQYIIIRLGLLQNHPHAFDEVAGVAPIALCVKIAKENFVLAFAFNGGDGARDLTRDERLASSGPFVIKQYAVRGVNSVRLTVVDRNPIGIELCGRIR